MWRKLVSMVLISTTGGMCLSCTRAAAPMVEVGTENIRKAGLFETRKPAKAHLADSSYVVYSQGFRAKSDTIFTIGVKYTPAGDDSTAVIRLPLREITYIEYYGPARGIGRHSGYLIGIAVITVVVIYFLVQYLEFNSSIHAGFDL